MITEAPRPGEIEPVDYPILPEVVLGNGLRVLVVEDRRLPRVSIRLAWPLGTAWNPDENLSLAELSVDLLKEGTTSRSSVEISDFSDQLAIQYGEEVSMEQAHLAVSVLDQYVDQGMELLSDLVLRPTFPEEEFQKVRARWQSHVLSQRSQPDFLAEEGVYRILFEDHPYAKISIPPEHLAQTERDQIHDFYKALFGPDQALLVFAGSVSLEQATTLAERYLSQWERREAPLLFYPPVPKLDRRQVSLVHRPHSVQAVISVATRALPRNHADTIPLQLASQVLGGGGSSRLFLNLREEKGYTYGAYSSLRSYRKEGLLLAAANVRSEVCAEAVLETLAEMERMRQDPPEANELQRCLAERVGAFIRRMESPASVGLLEISRRLHGLSEDYYRTYLPKLKEVTAEKVLETARAYIDPSRTLVAVVGDREQVEEKLRDLGNLTVYDTEGNTI